jgi:alanyl-tRNA synthetase
VSATEATTDRLYYTDAYRKEFSARVIDTSADGRRIYLDATAFYPTSGGQPHDIGTLGDVRVIDVIDEETRIAHVVESPLSSKEVSGIIDWPRRFDNMQQHTGQHLLSAVFEDLFGMKTVSVHFGDESSTLDLDADGVSPAQIGKALRRSNEYVAENRPVTVSFEDAAAAKELRKAVDRAGTLRIISIDGLDRSACGGTHVKATGEIGSVLIRGSERIRKTTRIQFVCGLRAVDRATADYAALSAIASALSVGIGDAPAIVASQAAQLKEADQARRKMEKELAGHRAAEMFDTIGASAAPPRIVFQRGAAATMDQLRTLGQAVTELRNCALVATTVEGNGLLVAANEHSGVDAAKLIREALAAVGGKGGGSPRLAQGTAASPEKLARAFDVIAATLTPDR